jgi:hypothetical protein
VTAADTAVVERQLRAALRERARFLGIDPESIRSPRPGALTARELAGGGLLSVEFRRYGRGEI